MSEVVIWALGVVFGALLGWYTATTSWQMALAALLLSSVLLALTVLVRAVVVRRRRAAARARPLH